MCRVPLQASAASDMGVAFDLMHALLLVRRQADRHLLETRQWRARVQQLERALEQRDEPCRATVAAATPSDVAADARPCLVADAARSLQMECHEAASLLADIHTRSSSPVAHVPSKQDALVYLTHVKAHFASTPAVYEQFIDTLRDFRNASVDMDSTIRRVKTLFQDDHSLLFGFNHFLPAHRRIELQPTFEHAMQHAVKIQSRFRDEPHVYTDFLAVLRGYKTKRCTKRAMSKVYQRVQELFRGHPDLLAEFAGFLPDGLVSQAAGVRTSSPPPPPPLAAPSIVYKALPRLDNTQTATRKRVARDRDDERGIEAPNKKQRTRR